MGGLACHFCKIPPRKLCSAPLHCWAVTATWSGQAPQRSGQGQAPKGRVGSAPRWLCSPMGTAGGQPEGQVRAGSGSPDLTKNRQWGALHGPLFWVPPMGKVTLKNRGSAPTPGSEGRYAAAPAPSRSARPLLPARASRLAATPAPYRGPTQGPNPGAC